MPVFSRVYFKPGGGADPDKLQLSGPSLPVEIFVSSRIAALLASQGTALPQPQTGVSLLDTGASITAIDQNVANSLQLSPIATTTVTTPGGQQQQYVYACQISFPGSPIPALQFNAVTGSQLAGFGYIALIGRDLLRHFQLVYNGVDGIWTLAF